MDTHVKRGLVYLQHQKHFEKWKRYWLTVYPDSGHGVARLELAEAGSDRSPVPIRRHPDRKVIRTADCVSVLRLPPHAEAYPAENMAAFCVGTGEKVLVFAVEKEDCGDWVEKICDIAFQKSKASASQLPPAMEKNEIYASREEVFEFQVSVLRSELPELCSLQGSYCLLVGDERLVLKNADRTQTVTEWPYTLLRRYGCDKNTFSIEAGRRCESGPGTVQFDTRQGDRIHRLMELSIQRQKNQYVSVAGASQFSPFSPLPQVPSIDSLLDALDSGSGQSVSPGPPGSDGSGDSGTTQRYSLGSVSLHGLGVYSEPADAIGSPHSGDGGGKHNGIEPLYSVPFDPRGSARYVGQAEPVYAEVLCVEPRSEPPTARAPQGEGEATGCSSAVSGDPCKTHHAEGGRTAVAEVIYSQVNKVREPTKPRDESTTHLRQKITSEDLGLI